MICLETHYPPIEVSTPATLDPVSIDEAKEYCDYEDSDRDDEFRSWVRTATRVVEQTSERAFVTQTCKLYLPYFPRVIEIAKPPVASVSSITYVDGNGDTQTLSTSVYQTNLKRTPPRIVEAYGQSWPTTRTDTENCVTVTFVAGYGEANAQDRDLDIAREAIKRVVKSIYDGCGTGMDGDMVYAGLMSSLRWRPLL